jgi:branched-chain amino acid transport system substrate-binding protein
MKKVLLSVALVVLVVGIALMGCAKPAPTPTPTPTPTPEPAKTLDIGIMAPLTGSAAHLGTNIKNGILLAIDDQNKGILMAGGQNKEGGVTIAGQKYMLNGIVFDDKLDLVNSKNIAEQLVFDKKVKVITGPFLFDAVGAQTVTEPNKIIFIAVTADVGGLGSPDKPYSFFCSGGAYEATTGGGEYIQKFYPDLKTVLTINPDLPSAPTWLKSAEDLFPRYGFEWLGYEKFASDIKDFTPVITRALAKKPDFIDTGGTAGDVGGMCASLIKQLRESGYQGIIWARTVPPIPVMMEIVPKQHLTKIVTNDILVDSPIVSQPYKDMYHRYVDMFGEEPIDIVGEMYNGVKAFFELLDGQDTMDTTVWMQAFAKHRWPGIWGYEACWVGKPVYGVDRTLMWGFWISEYVDGKPEQKWAAPVPYDLFGECAPE